MTLAIIKSGFFLTTLVVIKEKTAQEGCHYGCVS
jgi:hypothetical protein